MKSWRCGYAFRSLCVFARLRSNLWRSGLCSNERILSWVVNGGGDRLLGDPFLGLVRWVCVVDRENVPKGGLSMLWVLFPCGGFLGRGACSNVSPRSGSWEL